VGREGGLTKVSAASPPSFYMHLKDPHAHWEMIEGLESRYKVEECTFRTIFGTFQGYKIFASRKVAEKIEIQTRYAAELYNVDVRQDQRYMAEHDIFPCGDRGESRFSPDFEVSLTSLEIQVMKETAFSQRWTPMTGSPSCLWLMGLGRTIATLVGWIQAR
jgi:DNA polymerase I